jgi:serine protease Do
MKKSITTRTSWLASGTALLVAGGCLLQVSPANAADTTPGEFAPGNVSLTPVTVAAPTANGAVRDAVAIQNAFSQVSRAVEPAVVTIRTFRTGTRPDAASPDNRNNRGGSGGRFNPRNFQDNSLETPADFQDYLKQFKDEYGFAPNKAQRRKLRATFEKNQNSALKEVQERRSGGLGSGLIFRADGYIMTNAHVVSGARTVSVKLSDDREFENAQVIGVDERTDVAVVKVNAANLPFVQLGDSAQVQVGDWAIAIGNPYGLEHSMTVGVISAKAREMPYNRRESNVGYLQTDASINPGNSGGPLCDINGRVIGINNSIYSESGGNVGIGFAIPINTAKIIAEQLVNSGKVTRSYMGVTIATLNNEVAKEFKVDPALRGVLITEIGSGSPAQNAGLKQGDIVQGVNGQSITKSGELSRAIELLPVGSQAELKVLRNGKSATISVRVDESKS